MKNTRKALWLQIIQPAAFAVLLSGCLAGNNDPYFESTTTGGTTDGSSSTDAGTGSTGTGSTGGDSGSGGNTGGGSTGGGSTDPNPTATPVATATPDPGASPSATPTATPIVIVTPTPPVVCDPLGEDDGTASRKNGVKGKLFYYDDEALAAHPYSSVEDFYKWGHPQNVDFYMSSFYTPTRAFNHGFMTADGQVVTKANGDALYEHFAIKFSGGIQLPQGMANKKVQFAILSDDGSRLRMFMQNASDPGVMIVNNDGNHSTKLGCSNTPVVVSSDARIPFELDYYQGPRYHVSLILIWREWTEGMNANDPWCGKSGNDLFFDSTQTPSAPKAAWNDLMTRWNVVPANVLYINGHGSHATDVDGSDNPCVSH